MNDPGYQAEQPIEPDDARPRSEDVKRDRDAPLAPRRRRPDDDEDDDDRRDHGRRRRRYYDDDDDRGSEGLETLVPYKNPKGLMAYYFGVFSLIPLLGALLGPAAFIFGILGVKYANRFPEVRGKGHAISGIVMGSITTLLNWGGILFFGGLIAFSK